MPCTVMSHHVSSVYISCCFRFAFASISTEFLTLMKKVSKSPLVIDVLNIQGVQRQLERLADLLGKIQKALGEYLERERASFPRYSMMLSEDFRALKACYNAITSLRLN